MLKYTVYNDTRNQKKIENTAKVCEQLESFLNTFKFNKFEYALKAYSHNKNWNITYTQKKDTKGIERTIPSYGYLFIGLNQIRFEIIED